MIKDGSKAWEIKNFLVTQERCEEVTIEGKNYPGAAAKVSHTPLKEFLLFFFYIFYKYFSVIARSTPDGFTMYE